MDTDKAEAILERMGKVFRVKQIAQEAIDDLPFYLTDQDDPAVVGWDLFMHLLKVYGELDNAVANGVGQAAPTQALITHVRVQDAEDITQVVLHSVYTSIHTFRPDKVDSWDRWLRGVTRNHLNLFLRRLYREQERVTWLTTLEMDRFGREEEREADEETQAQYRKVRAVANRWIAGTHPKKALYAARILAIINSEEGFIGLRGSYMQAHTGVSRETLRKWTKQFILEVHNEGQG